MTRFRTPRIAPSEITDEKHFWDRRTWLATVGGAAAAAFVPDRLTARPPDRQADTPTPYDSVTGYNNFYEFTTDKEGVRDLARNFRTTPWTVSVEGEVRRPRRWGLDELLRGLAVEERVYRHRCVEAWSMVVPWNGVSLNALIRKLEPTSNAKYIEFTTLLDPEQMPGQRRRILDWPYVEALRMDEAMNPLALMVTGIYGRPIPPQNGAPLRLVVPWKYGFKGAKSIVKIRFTTTQPTTTWALSAPDEYGFYANVNPEVDHPRWSQGSERRIGEFRRRPTLPFNGYAEQVAGLYRGMDLRVNF
jgi:sulfoxide reductase catalytic subunit YedY